MSQVPDLAGFRAGQEKLRANFGETLIFFHAAEVTFPPDTPLDPETGLPYDPTIDPITTVTASATASGTVGFRTQVADGADPGNLGWVQDSDVLLISDLATQAVASGAIEVEVRGERYKITEMRPDGIGGLDRWLTWAKET